MTRQNSGFRRWRVDRHDGDDWREVCLSTQRRADQAFDREADLRHVARLVSPDGVVVRSTDPEHAPALEILIPRRAS